MGCTTYRIDMDLLHFAATVKQQVSGYQLHRKHGVLHQQINGSRPLSDQRLNFTWRGRTTFV